MIIRLAKIALSLSLTIFTFLVALNNAIDYESNFQFVKHVLSMDTTFPNNRLMSRAITEPFILHGSYWLIIAVQGVTCILFLVGTYALWRSRFGDRATFDAAKNHFTIGCMFGFVLWFVGFLAIGGEWFAMWQSKIWNGQESAFRFYMTILVALIFVNQPDRDLQSPQTQR
ncbi:hypothetical protein WL01_09800 [Burkholderia ubonensis]|uniref:DUF2165 family protein n=1 Tax=Burkholderia ubonensis TaxID=101571 RepID=UPI00075607EE|nr:DUF2165 domain-containing protein [Burkholderia ubonensis]KVC87921.1 hypothetical protein WI76_31580 [Burkholderia ubonensis]KVX22319.1 hypothetical protein WL01_09800 [Burkholderia ubonensis]KWB36931.1 hypothetical protein WL33_15985 [Burkholderia ubonensis]KWC12473.1 hypothetical protein WL48_08300 [Burkholderia ubonensis]KWC22297.1 hypothetical protein WL50_16540 [Burkholderia ubonensis]